MYDRKRLLLITVGGALLLITALLFATSGGPRYIADASVVARPYTNILLAPSFEAHVVRTIPGVLRLQMTTTTSFAGAVPALTNGVLIRIIAFGQTADEARRAANDAATKMCRTDLINYGVTGHIVDRADSARRYSYFREHLQPVIQRLFKR